MPQQGQGGAGYDFSLAGAASSGASLSGATDQGGSYILGPAYGPGGLILNDQRGSVGATAGAAAGLSSMKMVIIAAVIAAVVFFIPRK